MKVLRYAVYLGRNPLLATMLVSLSLMISVAACTFLLLDKTIFDRVLSTFDGLLLAWIAAAFIGLSIFLVALGFFLDVGAAHLKSRIAMQIKEDLVREILGYDLRYFISRDSGFIVKRIVEDTEMAAEGVIRLFLSGSQILQVAASVLIFHRIGWWLLSIYIALACAHITWSLLMKCPIEKASDNIGMGYGRLYDFFWEMLPGIKEVKLQGMQDYLAEKLNMLQAQVFFELRRNALWNSALWAIVVPLSWGFFFLVMLAGLERIREGDISTGVFVMVLGLLQVTLEPLNQLMESMGAIHRARSAIGRIDSLRGDFREPPGHLPFPPLSEGIRIRGLALLHEGGRLALDGVNLDIPKGASVAIVGESGSGKSSIAHVLLKLFNHHSGEVLLDGRRIADLDTRALRERISLVTQDVFLFRGTLRENIDPAGRLTDGRIQEICRVAQLDEFLGKLPDGVDTRVGDDGVDFSGGERQRISIARCLARESDVIILDEATSALDPRTEERLVADLREFLARKTLIAITHRPRLAEQADRIFVMAEGRVAEQGSHSELMERGGIYHRLFQSGDRGD